MGRALVYAGDRASSLMNLHAIYLVFADLVYSGLKSLSHIRNACNLHTLSMNLSIFKATSYLLTYSVINQLTTDTCGQHSLTQARVLPESR